MNTYTALVTVERQELDPRRLVVDLVAALATSGSGVRVLHTHTHSTGCLEDPQMVFHDDGSCSHLVCDPVRDLHQVMLALNLQARLADAGEVKDAVTKAALTLDPLGLWVTTFGLDFLSTTTA